MSLTSPSGELTNAVFGFTSMLLNVLREQAPEYVVVAFDVGKTFRHEMYDAYKGHRERMPDELRDQVERIKEVVNTLNIPVFTAEGYEADDVLATLARQAAGQGVNSLIVTGDRDILQVVDEHIRVLTSGRQFSDTIIYDPAAVEAKYGLRPDQLVDLKALVGDKSDNIPGVRGIGEKGATDLLQKYGTLDAVYEHLDEVKPDRARNALTEGRESAELSHRLGQITTAVPVQLDLAACRTRDYDRARVVALFQDLAFRSLVEKLPGTERRHGDTETRRHGDGGAVGAVSRPRRRSAQSTNLPVYQSTNSSLLVTTAPALVELAEKLAAASTIAFDTETTGTDPQAAELVGLAVGWAQTFEVSETSKVSSAYIPVQHFDVTNLPWETVRAALQPIFADPKTAKVAHNASYDLGMLARYGLTVAGELVDTMVAEWLIDPGSRGLGLKDLAWTRLKTEMTPISALIGTGKNQITMDKVPAETAGAYAGADAAMTLRLAEILLPELAQKGLDVAFPRCRDAAGSGAGRDGGGRGQGGRAAPAPDVGGPDQAAARAGG